MQNGRMPLLMLVVLMVGCGELFEGKWTDVTARGDLWGGYDQGVVYRTKAPLFIASVEDRYYVVPVGPSDSRGNEASWRPSTEEEYRASPHKWPSVVGVVEVGTQIKATQLRMFSTGTHNTLHVYGDIVTGPFAGRQVQLNSVSRTIHGGSLPIWEPNLVVLEPEGNQ